MKRYIIDGYNLLHKTNIYIHRGNLEKSRASLESLIETSPLYAKAQFTIVYDGQGLRTDNYQKSSRLKICFSSHGETADNVIKSIVDDLEGKKDTVVVSSDRSVFDYARVSRVGYMSAEDFLSLLTETNQQQPKAKHTKDKFVSEEEVKEWKKLFEQKSGEK